MARRKVAVLVANTAQNVTLTGKGVLRITCLKNPADIYFRFDGTTAVVRADDNFVCPAGGTTREACGSVPTAGLVISLISEGTPDVSVQLIDQIQGG